MLEKPDIAEDKIAACLQANYGLHPLQVAFLPLGVDQNTAVYRAIIDANTSYFVKLRGGRFDEITVTLPALLSEHGVPHIIAPLQAQSGHPWCALEGYGLSVFPFVEGRNGYETRVLEHQWRDLGVTLRAIHAYTLPPAIAPRIRGETYSPQARRAARMFLERAERETYADSVAAETAAFLTEKRDHILDLIARTERLARMVRARSLPCVLCHSDLHAGNFLIADDAFYLVDWDEIVIAPKERDLMFIGGGVGGNWYPPQEEERLFYEGYGRTETDPFALAYYRYDRIVQDIAAFCEQILLTDEGGDDRAQSLRYLMSCFVPGGVLDMACCSDEGLQEA